jgi:hypothetical protein
MSDTPKFEVIDRRKFKAEEEQESAQPSAPEPAEPAKASAPAAGPRLVATGPSSGPAPAVAPAPAGDAPLSIEPEDAFMGEMPPPPTAEETSEQKSAYDASAQRLEDLIRAQNPAIGAQQPVSFEQLVQQFYVSAMVQMGAGTPDGQRPRIDILGARQTIDMLGVLAEKTRGNLTEAEERMLETVLFEARMGFLEVTRMITLQGVQAPAPPKSTK